MSPVVLVIHMFLAVSIIGLVLLQRSEGGGLGIGGGGGGLGGVTTAKGAANMLSRATAICAGAFFCTSLILGIMAGHSSGTKSGLLDNVAASPAAQEQTAEDAVPAQENTINKEQKTDEAPAAPVAE